MAVSPTARFTDRARDYDAFRPSYPREAIDRMLAGLGDPAGLIVADIGAGTGIASRLLAQRGPRVIAVEPNEAMRTLGASYDVHIEWRNGTGEKTGLDESSVDLIACAQTFHWLDEDRALEEFARILVPRGRACLLWNIQDPSDGFTASYREILHAHAVDPPRSPSYATAPPQPFVDRDGWRDPVLEHIPNSQDLDLPGLIGRAVSSSYCPNFGDARDRVITKLKQLFESYAQGDRVTLRYQTELQVASRAQ